MVRGWSVRTTRRRIVIFFLIFIRFTRNFQSMYNWGRSTLLCSNFFVCLTVLPQFTSQFVHFFRSFPWTAAKPLGIRKCLLRIKCVFSPIIQALKVSWRSDKYFKKYSDFCNFFCYGNYSYHQVSYGNLVIVKFFFYPKLIIFTPLESWENSLLECINTRLW